MPAEWLKIDNNEWINLDQCRRVVNTNEGWAMLYAGLPPENRVMLSETDAKIVMDYLEQRRSLMKIAADYLEERGMAAATALLRQQFGA